MNITNINVGTTSNDGTGDNLRTAGIIINNNFQTIAGELTQLINANANLALGETSTTAYRGDRGATAYNHSQITHDKAFVGLGNVDNTSDANKPISTATQNALNGKVNTNQTINGVNLTGNITLNTSSISDSPDKRYVNDSQLTMINNSGNHTALSNLNWTSSGHIGTGSTVAGFNSTGATQFLTVSGSGSVVLSSNASATNLNLTTPILGTPQSGTLTNCNGVALNLTAGNISGGVVPIANGGTGVTTLAELLNAAIPAWTSWTPAIRNFTLGNGSLQGWYSKNGKTVDFRILLTVGSTSSMTGNVEIQLPFTAVTRPNFAKMSEGLLNANSIELIPIALLQISSDSWCRVVYLKSIAASAETIYVAPASNFYVNGYTYEFTGRYEIA